MHHSDPAVPKLPWRRTPCCLRTMEVSALRDGLVWCIRQDRGEAASIGISKRLCLGFYRRWLQRLQRLVPAGPWSEDNLRVRQSYRLRVGPLEAAGSRKPLPAGQSSHFFSRLLNRRHEFSRSFGVARVGGDCL